MTLLKIIVCMLAGIIAMGRLYVSEPGNPKLARNLSILIVLSMVFVSVIELVDNHRKNRQLRKAERAYKQIENLSSQNEALITQNNDLKKQNQLQIEEIQALKEQMIPFQTLNTLLPGNEPDPPITIRDKPPADAIKLYLGSCLAWWKSNGSHTHSLVTINNEPVLTLGLEENGLFLSGKIRRPEDGREVMNLINNKFVRNPNVFVDPQQPSEHELIVSGKSGERLLYVNYLNEKAIAIEGEFYDSEGNWILTIDDREIVDLNDNRFLPGASLGGNENIFSYQTLLRPYQLAVAVTQPALIKTGYRIDYMCDGKIVENPSEATIIVSNTGREPIRLGIDGEMELAISGQVLDLKMSPPMEKSDYVEWNGKRLKFTVHPGNE